MSRPSHRSLFVLACALCFVPLLVSTSANATVAASIPAAAPSKRLVLTVDAPAEAENWTPVESATDPATGALSFTTTHFSAYQATTDPELWKLTYNPPGASAYSGSATYSYSIELPPGIGGLTPDLSLSYSSRAAEGQTYTAMS